MAFCVPSGSGVMTGGVVVGVSAGATGAGGGTSEVAGEGEFMIGSSGMEIIS